MLIAAVVTPGGASWADARLARHGAIVTRAARHIAPHDPIAALYRLAKNVGARSGNFFNNATWLMPGDNWQGIAAAEWSMPPMHVGAAQCGSGDFDEERAWVQFGD